MKTIDYDNYEMLLNEAGQFHGDVCAGICIGTRMTMCGLHHIGIRDPKGEDRKKLVVFVEIDRCATDAIMALTGCRPGKRTMKVLDYGKMAATFINLETGKAVRVVPRMRNEANGEMPDFAKAREEDLFTVLEVEVPLRPEDLPGKPVRRCACEKCGDLILDGREVELGGKLLCQPCSGQPLYYRPVTKPHAASPGNS